LCIIKVINVTIIIIVTFITLMIHKHVLAERRPYYSGIKYTFIVTSAPCAASYTSMRSMSSFRGKSCIVAKIIFILPSGN